MDLLLASFDVQRSINGSNLALKPQARMTGIALCFVRLFKSLFADEAPRANDVGEDVDSECHEQRPSWQVTEFPYCRSLGEFVHVR
jgi:hypothetical protein